jgi:hypothetical protein
MIRIHFDLLIMICKTVEFLYMSVFNTEANFFYVNSISDNTNYYLSFHIH